LSLTFKRYYNCEKRFSRFYNKLKQLPCPHCKLTGALILHGYLSGYDENFFNKKAVRGRRIFCSTRRRRSKGCGRTFCVLSAGILKNFSITVKSLWCFLKNVVTSSSKIEAFRCLEFPPECFLLLPSLEKIFYEHEQNTNTSCKTFPSHQKPFPQPPALESRR